MGIVHLAEIITFLCVENIRLLRIQQQNLWLQLRPILFPNPGEFELLFLAHLSEFACQLENGHAGLWGQTKPQRFELIHIFSNG